MYEFRYSTIEDGAGIYNVQKSTWLSTYPNPEYGISQSAIEQRIVGSDKEVEARIERWNQSARNGDIYLATFNNLVVGFSSPFFDLENNQARLGGLYILQDHQGRGLGSKLIAHAFDFHQGKDIYLHATSYNTGAIKFYESHGFKNTGISFDEKIEEGVFMPTLEMRRSAH